MKKILAASFVLAGLIVPQKVKAITIIDSLGGVSPDSQFSIFGTGGLGISREQNSGPQFVLTQPTIITEIGGFVNNCRGVILGQSLCPDTLPFTVNIYSALNGIPDRANRIGRFRLSHDNEPLIHSYEFASPNLLLQPGVYFALFAPQGMDSGYMLESIRNFPPFTPTPIGVISDDSGDNVEQRNAGFRILGTPATEPPIDPIPEPTTLLGASLALGGGAFFKRKLSNKRTKA